MSHIQRFLRVKQKKMFISHNDAIIYLIDYVLKRENIDMKTDTTERDLRINEGIIKRNIKERDRIDNDLTPVTKVQLKRIIDILHQLGTTNKRFTYDEMIIHLINTYVEKYPDMEKYLLNDQYMKQKIAINKLAKRVQGMDVTDDD